MALTQIADVVVPEIFGPYVANLSKTTSAFIMSGAVAVDPVLSGMLAGGGSTFNFPSWAAPDAEAEYQLPTDDSTEITPVKSSALNDIAVRLLGTESYSYSQVARMLAGSDPHEALATHLAGVFAGKREQKLMAQLNGLFDTALAGLETDRAVEDTAAYTDATKFNSSTFIDGLAPFGDMLGNNYIIVCHSDVKAAMRKEGLIDFITIGDQNFRMDTYMGQPVIADDRCPKVAGSTSGFKYTTYVVAPGAISLGLGESRIWTYDNPLAGNGAGVEYLGLVDNFSFHVNGTRWTGTAAGSAPTAAELATGGNWAKNLDDKQMKVARLITNV